jgi:hypothetical protein
MIANALEDVAQMHLEEGKALLIRIRMRRLLMRI